MNHHRSALGLLVATAVAVAGCASSDPYLSPPDDYDGVHAQAEVGFFYDALSPYGHWFEVSPYGAVWSPYDCPVGWRPYSVGYWTYSDYGWMWISEDPWGWAPYHYGRWTYDALYGWIWVPGDEWSPAWVAWRYGDGWAGWAPLPPEVRWHSGAGLAAGSFDFDHGIEPYRWCFVRETDLATRGVRSHLVPSSRNVTLVRVTRNVTRYSIHAGRPVVNGPDPDVIQRDAGREIPRYRLVETHVPPRGSPVVRGRQIEVYRPAVREASPGQPPAPLPRPHVKPEPPSAALAHQEAESRRLHSVMERERAQLEREHKRELARPPAGVPVDELRRRQQQEMEAQQRKERREGQAIENRRQQLQKIVEQQREEQQRRNGERGQQPKQAPRPQDNRAHEPKSRSDGGDPQGR